MYSKSVFTTGEVANLLHIHQTTVIDWVDKGIMGSYKTPGGHRRISKDALFKFLDHHRMPVPNVLMGSSSNISNIEDEKHRHLHESFQVNPYSQSKPMDAFPPFPKGGGVRNSPKKAKLAQKKK